MEDKMGNELAVVGNRETQLGHVLEFNNEQIRLLGQTVAKDCTQDELAFFLNVCKLKRLDPFTGQVHCVKRWDSSINAKKMSIQVGIDGFRVIAARSGDLAGISEPEFDDEDGERPKWAKVTVYRYGRDNEKIPYTAKARFNEYVQTKQDGTANHMWANKPYIMLGKCAEALALRKAFPDELSGMYSDDEMGQADNEGTTTPGSLGPKPPVTMPRSVDEKKEAPKVQQGKAEKPPAQQQATQGQPQAEEISGEITDAKMGEKNMAGNLFVVVNKMVVAIPQAMISAEMVKGAKILVRAMKMKDGKTYAATSVEMVVPPAEEGEIIDAEVTSVPDKGAHEEYMKELGNDLFGAEKPKPQTTMEAPGSKEETKPGTAGLARAKRLYTLISQNHKNTGFTEEMLKKYLATQRIEHARDLACPAKGSEAFNAYEYACSMAVGEVDWHEVLED